VFTHRDRKAVITSSIYAPTFGSVQFRIEGYNAAGAKVAGADDSVTLYIDNVAPDFGIDDVPWGPNRVAIARCSICMVDWTPP